MDKFQGNRVFCGDGADGFAVAEQDGGDGFCLNEASCGADDSDVFALGENDAFRVAPELFE
jgi:hypothetical protein